MNILHIDSSILGEYSISRQLTQSIITKLLSLSPDASVTTHDLASDVPLHFSPAHLAIAHGAPAPTPDVEQDVKQGSTYIQELFTTDVIVIGAPMYNFTIPTQLKSWIDRILVAGQTFHYTEQGPQGLIPQGKKVFIASARGCVYSGESPAAHYDHQEKYLITALNFIGLTDISIIRAEGLALGDESKAQAVTQAQSKIDAITL